MHLIDNWRELLRRAWSIRLIILAGILTGLEAVLPFFHTDWPYLKFITLIVVAAALMARLVAQKDLK